MHIYFVVCLIKNWVENRQNPGWPGVRFIEKIAPAVKLLRNGDAARTASLRGLAGAKHPYRYAGNA